MAERGPVRSRLPRTIIIMPLTEIAQPLQIIKEDVAIAR